MNLQSLAEVSQAVQRCRESVNSPGLAAYCQQQSFDVAAVRKQYEKYRGAGGKSMRPFIEMGMTSVVATQLWHHIYCGGGLCDLPTWSPPGFGEGRDAGSTEGARVSPALAG